MMDPERASSLVSKSHEFEECLRIFVQEVAKDIFNRPLARVGAGGNKVLPLDLALQIEGDSAIEENRFVVVIQPRREQISRARRFVAA